MPKSRSMKFDNQSLFIFISINNNYLLTDIRNWWRIKYFSVVDTSSIYKLFAFSFQRYALNYFPEIYGSKLFDFIKQCSTNNNTEVGQADKRQFLLGISQILRGTSDQRAQALYFMAAKSHEVPTIEDLSALCFALTQGYIKAIEKSGSAAAYKHQENSTTGDDHRLADMLLDSIPGECRSRDITVEDIEKWMCKQVLLSRIFEDVCKACFLGPDSIVETHWHGIKQGCEPTIEHVERKYVWANNDQW